MALPASDSFTRANENPITTNWTTGEWLATGNVLQLLSNAVRSSSTGDAMGYWDADAFNANQWSECKITSGSDGGPAVRMSSDGSNHKCYYWTPFSDGEVWRYTTADSWTKIGEANFTITATDVVRLEATGTGATVTLKVYKNGSLQTTLTDSTANRILSGAAGVYSVGSTTLDDWGGDNVSGSSPSGSPSSSPSNTPSSSPSNTPSGSPSGSPSEGTPSGSPSEGTPSGSPSEGTPSASPSEGTPSASPSEGTPSASPSEGTPSGSPSEGTPSGSPSEGTPSGSPSEGTPSASPSEGTPSGSPSGSPSASPSAGECDLYETFEDVIGSWNLDTDTNGTGAVTRSNEQADAGTYSAKCFTTASGDVAQVREVINSTWAPAAEEWYWQHFRMYIPAATVANLTGSEYMDIAGFYPSAGGSYGWWLRIMEGGAMYVHGYEAAAGGSSVFNIYGTIPTGQWFDLEIGLHSKDETGIGRSFAVLVNGAFYGWYRRGNEEATFNRIAAGILGTNSADDLSVYVDTWYLYGTTEDPCGTDNRPTTDTYTKDYTDPDGENLEIHWYTWVNDVRLDANGLWSHDDRLQGGINHGLMPSFVEGWAEIEIQWVGGVTPTWPPAQYFAPMIAFRKDIGLEENLEIQCVYAAGNVLLQYDAWVNSGTQVFHTWQMPEEGADKYYPGDGDRMRVRWDETGGTNLRVRVDYYDATTSTWTYDVIDTTDDLSNVDGINFFDGTHTDTSLTIDSTEYAISYQKIGINDFPSPSASPSGSPSEGTPSGSPSEGTPSGSPSEGTPSGSPSEGTPSGSPSEGTPSGSPSEGTPSGSPSEGTPSGSPSEGTPSGSPSEGTPSGSPSEGTPSASPSEGTPSGSPSEGTPSGSPSEGTPSGSPSEGTPSASPSEGTPSASPSEGTPSGSPSASPSEGTPSASPSEGTPSGSPSEGTPSASPSEGTPSGSPSEGTPSGSPSEGTPSGSPSEGTPSASPSEGTPSGSPSEGTPSASPSEGTPSGSPSASPSEGTPSGSPSEGTPSGSPSPSPSASPSEAPEEPICRPIHFGPQIEEVPNPIPTAWDGVEPIEPPLPISGVVTYDSDLDEPATVYPKPHYGQHDAPVPSSKLYYWVDFNGTTSAIACGTDASITNLPLANMTVDAWVRADSYGENNVGQVVSKSAAAFTNGWFFGVISTAGLYAAIRHSITSAQSRSGLDDFTADGLWHHLVMAWNHTGDQRIYFAIDGTWIPDYDVQFVGAGVHPAETNPLLIGDLDGIASWDGAISWLRISNALRWAIGANFMPPPRCAPPGVDGATVEIWRLDEGAGTSTAAKVHKPANNGTMTDCTWERCS